MVRLETRTFKDNGLLSEAIGMEERRITIVSPSSSSLVIPRPSLSPESSIQGLISPERSFRENLRIQMGQLEYQEFSTAYQRILELSKTDAALLVTLYGMFSVIRVGTRRHYRIRSEGRFTGDLLTRYELPISIGTLLRLCR